MPVGQNILLGSFPDKKTAQLKRAEISAQYRSANNHEVISRKSWDPKFDLIVKPSSLMR